MTEPDRPAAAAAEATGPAEATPQAAGAAAGSATEPADPVRLTAWVHGQVQGVGFRWWTRSRALELGLVGRATNLADGGVEVVAEGSPQRCAELLAALEVGRTPGTVDAVTHRYGEARGGLTGFVER